MLCKKEYPPVIKCILQRFNQMHKQHIKKALSIDKAGNYELAEKKFQQELLLQYWIFLVIGKVADAHVHNTKYSIPQLTQMWKECLRKKEWDIKPIVDCMHCDPLATTDITPKNSC